VGSSLRRVIPHLLLLACLLPGPFTRAETTFTAKQLIEVHRGANTELRQQLNLIIEAWEDGVKTANSFSRTEGRRDAVLYCSPGNMVLKADSYGHCFGACGAGSNH
jgi:hypothetical protein